MPAPRRPVVNRDSMPGEMANGVVGEADEGVASVTERLDHLSSVVIGQQEQLNKLVALHAQFLQLHLDLSQQQADDVHALRAAHDQLLDDVAEVVTTRASRGKDSWSGTGGPASSSRGRPKRAVSEPSGWNGGDVCSSAPRVLGSLPEIPGALGAALSEPRSAHVLGRCAGASWGRLACCSQATAEAIRQMAGREGWRLSSTSLAAPPAQPAASRRQGSSGPAAYPAAAEGTSTSRRSPSPSCEPAALPSQQPAVAAAASYSAGVEADAGKQMRRRNACRSSELVVQDFYAAGGCVRRQEELCMCGGLGNNRSLALLHSTVLRELPEIADASAAWSASGSLRRLRFSPAGGEWQPLTPMTTARVQHKAITLAGGLYVTGGHDGQRCLATCERYDLATGRWEILPSMRQPRRAHGLIFVAGAIMVTGGLDEQQPAEVGCERFFPGSDEWDPLPNMGVGRYNHSTVVLTPDVLPDVFVVSSQPHAASKLMPAEQLSASDAFHVWQDVPPLPMPAWERLCAAKVKERLYVIATLDGGGAAPALLRLCIDKTRRWEHLPRSELLHHCVEAVEAAGRLFVFGRQSDQKLVGLCDSFDPETNRWERVSALPTLRRTVRVAALGGELYLFGGQQSVDEEEISLPQCYNISTATWRPLQLRGPPIDQGLPCARVSASCSTAVHPACELVLGTGAPL
eukprot:TRINITY_DN12737_c0_g1_i3.p1 TRINITY_DN12737_c0_g1~~TRINITY_DN12737_c0_g1_i3.p1  ORF type:complete len:688 (+),score=148.03 TRINITY_DN12737_c0_g1_i3:112-2175(+)